MTDSLPASEMTFPIIYSAIGVLLFIFAGYLAAAVNVFALRLYEIFPKLWALPRSHLAAQNRIARQFITFFESSVHSWLSRA
jgi:hypothetical protein